MSQLARDLLNKGHALVNPFEEHQQKKLLALQQKDESSSEDKDYIAEEEEEEEESSSEEDKEEDYIEEQEAIMPKTSGKKMPVKSSSSGLDSQICALSIGDKNIQPIVGNLCTLHLWKMGSL